MLPRVLVAVIDSGIDGGHPDLDDRIVGSRSFVGTPALQDSQGHGTFVAGVIAATVNNEIGIAGMAPAVDLLVAKVVAADGTIDIEAEARAIRWAVRSGARVINMSLGGLRDPRNAALDSFSPLEAAAIGYARKRNVVVVAAVGNGDSAPRQPWPYATYPAALPHVLGVSAIARNGSSPTFSNRDKIYNDLAAPGQGIVSTLPRALTSAFRECAEQGYSVCGTEDWRAAEGTSFAAPQVSAAAAMLIAERPSIRSEQVTALLTGTAVDANPATGCLRCPLRRDELTGWGRLDMEAALRQLGSPLPPPDTLEPNDDAGPQAVRLWGQTKRLSATLDFWDDQNDVYAIRLRRDQPVFVGVRGPAGTDTNLMLWHPATRRVDDLSSFERLVKQSARPGPREWLSYRAPRAGWYFVQVKLGSRGAGRYRLSIVKALSSSSSAHVAQDARRVADDERPRRDVLRHDGARSDERLLADLDSGAEDRAAADPRAAADRRALHQLEPLLGAAHEVVVRRHHARGDEDVLLQRRVGGHVRLGLDLRARADRRVVLDQRAAADDDVVADRDALAHAGLVAEDHALADLRAREDDRARRDDRAGAEHGRRQRLALRRRARRERRLLADDGVLEHLDAVAEHRSGVDDRGRMDVSHATRPSHGGDSVSRSSARTTVSPSRASLCPSGPFSTSERKCWHSSRSGSSFEIFGLKMSPVRVRHSP